MATAEKIAQKHPLTAEEAQLAALMKKTPEEYPRPTEDGVRECGVCGAKFEDGKDRDGKDQTAMQCFVDHQAEHNPSPAQWTVAQRKIQAVKEKPKA